MILIFIMTVNQCAAVSAEQVSADYVRSTGEEYAVPFDLDFNEFLESDKEYKEQIAFVSSILSGLAYYSPNNKNITYDKIKIKNETNTYKTFNLNGFMEYLGFLDTKVCYLGEQYTDNDVIQFHYGYKKLEDGNTQKYLVPIILRGTVDSKEWSSNFDIGKSGSHRGFNVTANRVLKEINVYLEQHNINPDNAIIWVTGHSRGGGVANLLAKKMIDKKYKMFAYTFASPLVTQSKNTNNALYKGIFNIINEQDFVPKLPLSKWGFQLYGTKKESRLTELQTELFKSRVGENYKAYSDKNMERLIQSLEEIAETREACFQYTCACHSRNGKKIGKSITITSENYENKKKAKQELSKFKKELTAKQIAACKFEVVKGKKGWTYTVCQTPLYFMLKMAEAMNGSAGARKFVLSKVGEKYTNVKRELITASPNIGHPHFIDSYILLVQ